MAKEEEEKERAVRNGEKHTAQVHACEGQIRHFPLEEEVDSVQP